jgi:predicted phage terminase large subunit-like protein
VILEGKTDGKGNIYATGGIGGQWTIAQLAINVILEGMRARPLKILIEETASAKYFVEYVRMVCRDKGIVLPLDYIKLDNRKDAKIVRMRAMAGHVKNGRLKFLVGLSFWDKFVEQITKLQPGNKHQHDDYPDTMALMCSVFAGKYLNIPAATIPVSRNSMVALLERDVVFSTVEATELPQVETMGGEFV